MKIQASFRGLYLGIEVDDRDEFIALNFDGCYLIEFDLQAMEVTGNAIDGGGNTLSFNPQELIIQVEG